MNTHRHGESMQKAPTFEPINISSFVKRKIYIFLLLLELMEEQSIRCSEFAFLCNKCNNPSDSCEDKEAPKLYESLLH